MPSTSSNTVKARPISFAEIEHLEASREPQEVYYLTDRGTLTPATVTVFSRSGEKGQKGGRRSASGAYYAAILDEKATQTAGHPVYKYDIARGPVGQYLKVEIRDVFGTSRDGGMFTAQEAEEGAGLTGNMSDPGHTRRHVYVPDSHAEDMPLTPVYGSMLTFSGAVAGIDPTELAERAERVLRAEFGPTLGRFVKVLTRPVEDRRVDVFDSVTGKPLALGILAAEVHQVKRVGNAVTVTDSDPSVILGG